MMDIKQFLLDNNLPQPRSIKKLNVDAYHAIVEYTRNIDTSTFGVRVYCAFHEIQYHPVCDCGSLCTTARRDSEYGRYAFSNYCSVSCASKDKSVIEKRKKTCLQNHGVEVPYQSEKIRLKGINTNRSKYGADYYFQTDEFVEKNRQSSLDKYGVEHHASSENTKQKRTSNNIERYGFANVFQTKEVKQKIKDKLLSEHGADNAMKIQEFKQKAIQTNIERYKCAHPMQNEEVKQRAVSTSQRKYGTKNHAMSHIPKEVYDKLTDPVFMQSLYDEQQSVANCASVLNIATRTFCVYFRRLGLETINIKSVSNAEREICQFLDDNNISYRQSDRSLIGPKELDIIIDDHRLCIEHNGLFWHSTEMNDDKYYHQKKSLEVNEKGYRLIHVYEDEWTDDVKREIIKTKILYSCNKITDRVYARKCRVLENESRHLMDFYDENHIQGYIDSSINYVLVYDDNIVAALSLKKSKIENQYYITRYATSINVVGGFSKLLKHFVLNHENCKSIVTYANLNYSLGDLYQKTGFNKIKVTEPNYFYYNQKRHSRQHFMKHKLKDRLDVYDASLTESENMKANGYLKIYDAGSILYEMRT